MVDKHHDAQLPQIARLLDDLFSVGRSWLEPKCSTGETPDVFSVVERRIEFGNADMYPGQSIVSDYKSSVADLRADASKPWRQKAALGDWRLVWLRKDGDVRPEHVDEGKGWGVVMFDDHQAEVVRDPEQFHPGHVAWHAQTAMIVRLLSRSGQPGKRDKRKYARNKKIDEAIELIAQGPLMTGQIKRLIGYKGQKLADELEADGRAVQQGVGGNWVLREQDQ